MIKKICLILIAAIVLLMIASCGNSPTDRQNSSGNGNSVGNVLKEKTDGSASEPPLESRNQNDKIPKGPGNGTAVVDNGKYDVDLTILSSTMVYSEVSNMISSPENYLGKKIKMKGLFWYTEGEERYYFGCTIMDATACCSQGLEFILAEDKAFPDEYPETDEEITVVGIFDRYYEGDSVYFQLINAIIV